MPHTACICLGHRNYRKSHPKFAGVPFATSSRHACNLKGLQLEFMQAATNMAAVSSIASLEVGLKRPREVDISSLSEDSDEEAVKEWLSSFLKVRSYNAS